MQGYDAFISYRHQDTDEAIVEALQNKLEKLKKSDGEHLRICRDRTDLSATSDLDAGIKEKLENSRFLIVLCTPGYSESPWCIKELRYFRQLHGNSNAQILPVLIEGEPKDVFPEELLWEDRICIGQDGLPLTVRASTEPLGADLRADTQKETLRLLRTEYLRVAAPILGKTYDALYQRERRRQLLLWGSIGGAVLLGMTLFALYNQVMLTRIDSEHQALLANESHRIAVAAEEEIDAGNSNLALLLALEALPKDLKDPERPIVTEAEAALRSAVYSRMIQEHTDLLQDIARIDLPSINWGANSTIFDNGSKIYAVDSGSLYIYDTANGMLLLEAPMGISGFYWFNSDMTHVLVAGSDSYTSTSWHYTLYDIASGQQVYQNIFQSAADFSDSIDVVWDSEKDICYFLSIADDREPIFLDAVYANGTPAPKRVISSELLNEWRKISNSSYWNGHFENSIDYMESKGALTDRGQRYQSVIERYWSDRDYSAHISEDECLLVIHNSYEGDRVYSLNGSFASVALSGDCTVDAQHRRLYVKQDTSLCIYSYQPPTEAGGTTIDRISNDAQRCMKATYCIDGVLTDYGTISSKTPKVLLVWDYDDFSKPLLEIRYKSYCLTPDMLYALVISEENTLQLWHAYQGMVTEIPLQEEKPLLPCINADGSLLAVACYGQQTVDIYSSEGNRLRQIPVQMEHDYYAENYSEVTRMEFEGSHLLISCRCDGIAGYSQIVDVLSQDPPVIIEDYSSDENMESQDCLLTSDGLLFCTGSVFGDALDAIYDIETGERIFLQTAYFQYNEASGILLYAPVGPQFSEIPTIHAARRDETGMFRDFYAFDMKNSNSSLRYAARAMDPDYFLLNSAWQIDGYSRCEAYEIATGEYFMTIRTSAPDNRFYISDGFIYYTGYHPDDAGASFPILDLPDLVEIAKSYLTSDSGTRSLTDAEKAKFYID